MWNDEKWVDISEKQIAAQFLGGASNDKIFSRVERAGNKFPFPEGMVQIMG